MILVVSGVLYSEFLLYFVEMVMDFSDEQNFLYD